MFIVREPRGIIGRIWMTVEMKTVKEFFYVRTYVQPAKHIDKMNKNQTNDDTRLGVVAFALKIKKVHG